MDDEDDYRVGVGLGLSALAGLATAGGSALSFCLPTYNPRIFAVCLSLSAGVMLYISFIEIFYKSRDEFIKSGYEKTQAYPLATAVFFCGMVLAQLLDWCLHRLFGFEHDHDEIHQEPHVTLEGLSRSPKEMEQEAKMTPLSASSRHKSIPTSKSCPIPAPSVTLSIEETVDTHPSAGSASSPSTSQDPPEATDKPKAEEDTETAPPQEARGVAGKEAVGRPSGDKGKLLNLSLFSGLALALHNFPEGIATFAAALADPRFGLGVAVAIGIHNFPEGVAVSVPIYYATGSRCKAFTWSLIAGLAEPVGAVLTWLILSNNISSTAFAILFGLVGGLMVHISVRYTQKSQPIEMVIWQPPHHLPPPPFPAGNSYQRL